MDMGNGGRMHRDKEQMSIVNVSGRERLFSLIGGALLSLFGIARKSRLGALLALLGGYLVRRGTTGHDPVYQRIGVNTAVKTNVEQVSVPHQQGVHIHKSLTVNRSPAELYDFWRNFENLPRFMKNVRSVRVLSPTRSHWVVEAPAGATVEWDAEIHHEVPNEVIGWRTLADAQIAHAGSVRFAPAPGGRGTEVTVTMEYVPPAGPLGVVVAKLFGKEPGQQIEEDLRNFKQLMETEEVPASPQDLPSMGM
jgi:uncharacterized membrane protein